MFEAERPGMTRRQALRRMGAASALVAAPTALLEACGSAGPSKPQATGARGTSAQIPSITWALGAAPPGLDIATAFVDAGVAAMVLGLEPLLTVSDTLSLTPLLAESWTQPDVLHSVYKIRSGVTFWDGSPLTAQDVAYSLGRHIDPKVSSQLGSYYAAVKSIDVTGADEVTVTMKRPDPLFPNVLAFSFITPKA